jgi:pimeloyl-ACP methyl ester carboxylesterase
MCSQPHIAGAARRCYGRGGRAIHMPFHESLFYEEPPAGAGKPLLLLHGLGAHSYTWRHLRPAIPGDYKPYFIDLKGFGQAKKPDDEQYSPHDQAALVCGLIDTLGPAPVTIVGHSMGGAVALITALRLLDAGKPPARLVLIGAVSYPVAAFRLVSNPVVKLLLPAVALLPAKLLIRAGLKKAFFDDAKITPDMVEAYAAPLAAPGGKAALRKAGTMLFPPDLAALGTRYPEIAAPTLLLWGRQDELIGLGDGQKLEAALPNAALEIVESCGHIPHEERPTEAVPKIAAFLAAA